MTIKEMYKRIKDIDTELLKIREFLEEIGNSIPKHILLHYTEQVESLIAERTYLEEKIKWKNCLSPKETLKLFETRIKSLLAKYPQKDRNSRICVEQNFLKDIGKHNVFIELYQLYSIFGMIPPNRDNNYLHMEYIKKHFGLDRNIVDAAGGRFPAFAKIVRQEQIKIGAGTITVIDPSIIQLDEGDPLFEGIKLERRQFTLEQPLPPCDLLTGISPCDATEAIIDSACRNKIDFYLAFCPCEYLKWREEHSSEECGSDKMIEIYTKKYIKDARERVYKAGLGELEITFLDNGLPGQVPIIHNVR